ncbi:MAG: hypothetical protein C4313_02730 [Thermoflexus sp.]|uniref:hypothetical protein n=1 Tax=Thermoflexus sp. TaxID=1969742 RepID=UPI00331CFDA6
MGTLIQAIGILLRPHRRTLLVGGGVFLLGLAVGLVYGWYIAPVEWTDAAPVDLRLDYRDRYLRLLVMAVQGGFLRPEEAHNWLGERWLLRDAAQRLRSLANQEADPGGRAVMAQLAALWEQQAPPSPPARGGGGFSLPTCLLGLIGLGLILLVFFLLFRWRRPAPAPARRPAAGTPAGTHAPAAVLEIPERPEVRPGVPEPPLSQHRVTYKLGDDAFDLSFPIELPSGEFLGEYGVAISETIGVGDPAKVTAFEVWLFDKNDIKTVTRVLASEHAYRDPALQARLRPKGDLVLATPGGRIELETRDLRLEARVVEMEYGTGALPPNSFFNRLTLELAAWRKAAPPEA